MRSSERPDLDDPWAIPAARAGIAPWRSFALSAAVAAIGASGAAIRLWRIDAEGHRLAALALLATAIVAEVVLRRVRPPWHWLGLVAVAAVAAAATVPSVGRAPVVVAVASTLVAHAALVEWRPTAGWRPRATPVAALGLAPLVVAQLVWIRGAANGTAALLLGGALVVVELHHRAPALVGPVDRAVARAIGALATAVASVALLAVALPTLYLGGALGHAIRRIVPAARPPRGWVDRSDEADQVLADAGRPFSTAPPRVRRLRNATGLAVLAAVAVITLAAIDARRGEAPPRRVATRAADRHAASDPFEQIDRTPYSERPGYASMPFADRMQEELLSIRLEPDPLTGYRNGAASGRYVNVVDGSRVTLRPDCDCPTVTLWFGGASTAFGVGQRDDHTVASELVRLAERDGIALDVLNTGVPGWTIWQEARDFRRRLDSPAAPPDVAVFLDGFNDALGTITQSVVAGRIDDGPTVMDNDDVLTATRRRLDAASVGGGAVLGDEAARRYRVEMEAIATDARARSIEVVHYFQPDAFASPRQAAAVEGIYAFDPDLFERAEAPEALEAMSTALEPDVHNLRHALDGVRRPVFGDAVHINEVGASLVAAEMYRTLGPTLRRIAAER